jgi:SAM-dependent methyltransferase
LGHVVAHNLKATQMAVPFARRRTEHLIYILHSIPSVNKNSRLLSIGPRNEGDLLLLRAHGFKNVEGIDLFSYSPLIRIMDMHQMEYPDNTFDLISCGWTVRYSYDIRKCVSEMVRVCRDGAHIAIGFSMDPQESSPPDAIGTLLHGGIDELLGYFGPHVGYVYWRMEDQNRDETNLPECTNSVVLRIKK